MDRKKNLVYVITAGDTASELYVAKVCTNEKDAELEAKILGITNIYVNVTATELTHNPPTKTHTFQISGAFTSDGNLSAFAVFDINMNIEHDRFEFSHGSDNSPDSYVFSGFMNYDINESKSEFMERAKKALYDSFNEWLKNPVDFIKEK